MINISLDLLYKKLNQNKNGFEDNLKHDKFVFLMAS